MPLYDAAIIGGGPAGSAAAISLARAGHSVLLLEAKAIPHDTLCGEFLSPECQSFLAQLEVTAAVNQLAPAAMQTAALIANDGTRWVAPLPGVAFGLSRARLDAALLNAAAVCGATVHDRQSCIAVNGNLLDGFALTARSATGDAHETYRARVVISAHGKRSTMDRVLARPFLGRRYPLLGMKRHFRGPPVPDGVALHAFAGGYCGLANIERGLVNLCFLVHEDVFKRATANAGNPDAQAGTRTAAILAFLAAANPTLAGWLHHATPDDTPWQSVGALVFGARSTIAHDILMVGDAAGLLAPLAGDGIGMALQSGILCAAHTARFLRGAHSAAALRTGYTRAWNAAFQPRIRLAGFLQALALRPPLLRVMLRFLQRTPAVGKWLVRHTRAT